MSCESLSASCITRQSIDVSERPPYHIDAELATTCLINTGDTVVHEIKHVSAKKMAADVVIREAKGFTDPAFTKENLALYEKEIAFFKANGFLLSADS